MTPSQTEIERRLARTEPDVEVLLVEVLPNKCVRVFIDHPDGVTLSLCERVTMRLNELRELYALEVSSPGSKRPLTKPAHFRRFLGRRARVRTFRPRPLAGQAANGGSADGRSSEPANPSDRRSSDPERLAAPTARRQSRQRGRAAEAHDLASRRSSKPAAPAGTTSFTGELVAASEEEVTLAAPGGVIAIPYSEIRRSNLLEE
jgi:ribosome maturation factor RimP